MVGKRVDLNDNGHAFRRIHKIPKRNYDTDEEKSLEITTGAETKIENAAALTDIKAGDWVDVTYAVKDAKNTAKSVFVEKEEEIPAETAGAADAGTDEE